jgi:hypothetical protein
VSQNQAMLVQLTGGRPDDAAARRAGRDQHTQQQLDDLPRWSSSSSCARGAAHIYRHADTADRKVVDIEHAGHHRRHASPPRRPTARRSRACRSFSSTRPQAARGRPQRQQEQKDRLDNAKAALEELTTHQKKRSTRRARSRATPASRPPGSTPGT